MLFFYYKRKLFNHGLHACLLLNLSIMKLRRVGDDYQSMIDL